MKNSKILSQLQEKILILSEGRLLKEYEFNAASIIFHKKYYIEKVSLEEKYKISLEIKSALKEIHVYGKELQIQASLIDIGKLIKDSTVEYLIYEFKGKNISSFFDTKDKKMQEFYKKYDLSKKDFDFNFRKKEFSILCKKELASEIRKEITNLIEREYFTNNNKPINTICLLCNAEVSGPYCLMGCKDIFCKTCLSLYVLNYLNDQQIKNITCPNENCNFLITLRDLRFLTNSENVLYRLFEKSLSFYNSKKHLPDPYGCNVTSRTEKKPKEKILNELISPAA